MPRDDNDRNVDRRDVLKTVGTGVVGASFAGCMGNSGGGNSNGSNSNGSNSNGSNSNGSNSNGGSNSPQSSLSVGEAHYTSSTSSLSTMVAKEKGFFRQEGISIEKIISFSGGTTTVRGITSGGLELGMGSPAAAARAWNAGTAMRVFGKSCYNPIDVVVKPDSDIETIRDLKGKTIGYSNPASSSQMTLVLSLKRADGISLNDVNLKAMGGLGESLNGVKNGIIDAGWCTDSESIGNPNTYRRLFGTWEYAPQFATNVFFTTARNFQENEEVHRKFANSIMKAIKFIHNNNDESAEIWAKFNDSVSNKLTKKVLQFELKNYDNYFDFSYGEDMWSSIETAMLETGAIEDKPDWDKLVVQKFIPKNKRVKLP